MLPSPSQPIYIVHCSTVGVLSAMFGVTNRLIDAANHAIKHDKVAVSKIRGDLLDAHVATAKGECVGGKKDTHPSSLLLLVRRNIIEEVP